MYNTRILHASVYKTRSNKESLDNDGKIDESTTVVLNAALGYSHQSVSNAMPAYAVYNDYYWHQIKIINPVE